MLILSVISFKGYPKIGFLYIEKRNRKEVFCLQNTSKKLYVQDLVFLFVNDRFNIFDKFVCQFLRVVQKLFGDIFADLFIFFDRVVAITTDVPDSYLAFFREFLSVFCQLLSSVLRQLRD